MRFIYIYIYIYMLDIVQSFPLLSYCIVGPMSVYIYKSNM